MMGSTQFKVGSEPPEHRLKYLEKISIGTWAQESNPEPPAWKSGVLSPEPPVLCSKSYLYFEECF